MAYTWDNRCNFVVKHLYDTDSNGVLEKHDFECMALKMTVLEGKGLFDSKIHQENLNVMLALWDEVAQLADFNKDGVVTTDEFQSAVQKCCLGKKFDEFPQAMKMFINNHFKLVDVNGDGVIGIEEYRYNCVSRLPVGSIEKLDEAYQKLLNDDDKRRGGLTLSRYQELYGQFLGDNKDNIPAVYLFGPLSED